MLRLLALGLISTLLFAAAQADNQALAQRAVEAERTGDFAGAISAFNELVKHGADSAELRSNLGIAYYQLHEFSEALRQFHLAVAKNPESVTANLFSGLSLLKLQRAKEALPYLQTAHRSQPNASEITLALAGAEIASNDASRARALYEEAAGSEPANAEAWYGLGIADRILAEQEVTQAKHAGSQSVSKAATSKSRALLDASAQAIDRAMQLDPGSVRARMILGESFRIAERYDLAVQEYQAATEQQPNSAPAWAGLAAAYSASGDDPNALKAAARALELDSTDAATTAVIAGTYLRLGDYAKAEQYAIDALKLQPGLSTAQIVLAKIYLAQEQPRKALPELLSASKDDNDGATYYLLARTLRKLGRSSEAEAAMQKYRQLHSAHVAIMSSTGSGH